MTTIPPVEPSDRTLSTDVPTRLEMEIADRAPHHVAVDRRSVRYVVARLLGNPSSIIGTVLLVAFSVIALAAPVLAPCPPDQRITCQIDAYRVPKYGFVRIPQVPSAEHWFGTTPDQYDIYYGVVWGTRTAFKAGVTIVLLSLLLGLTIGSIAAYYGGWIDESLMRIVEIFQAFPYFLAAITLATVLRSAGSGSHSIAPAVIALVLFGWMGYARLVRADILSVKQREYVMASRGLGASDLRIILQHILPNSIFPVLVVASLDIGTIVQSFAGLSFFGLGVPAGYADWGQMISGARNQITSAAFGRNWYIVVYPGLAIVFFSLAWNLIGDTVRDILDPRYSQDG
ncbi:MAG: ABC transporter permease [Ardenticatenales bacterium]